MTSDDDWSEMSFIDTCDKHDYRCWRCGKPKADPAGVLGNLFTWVFAMAMFALFCAPMFWIVKVVWGWVL